MISKIKNTDNDMYSKLRNHITTIKRRRSTEIRSTGGVVDTELIVNTELHELHELFKQYTSTIYDAYKGLINAFEKYKSSIRTYNFKLNKLYELPKIPDLPRYPFSELPNISSTNEDFLNVLLITIEKMNGFNDKISDNKYDTELDELKKLDKLDKFKKFDVLDEQEQELDKLNQELQIERLERLKDEGKTHAYYYQMRKFKKELENETEAKAEREEYYKEIFVVYKLIDNLVELQKKIYKELD